jgi:hypothetical protein
MEGCGRVVVYVMPDVGSVSERLAMSSPVVESPRTVRFESCDIMVTCQVWDGAFRPKVDSGHDRMSGTLNVRVQLKESVTVRITRGSVLNLNTTLLTSSDSWRIRGARTLRNGL